MKLLNFLSVLLVSSSLTAYELKPGALEMKINNDSKAEITFKLTSDITKPASIRIMRKQERTTIRQKIAITLMDTVVAKFYPDRKECAFSLISGGYVLEIEESEEGFVLRLPKTDINVGQDMYIKDGKAVYTKPVVVILEANVIQIKGKLLADNSIIKTAREICFKKQGSSSLEAYKLKITNGEIEGVLKEEGTYEITILLVEMPKLKPEFVTAQVNLSPTSFLAKKGTPNTLMLKATPKIQKVTVSSSVAETYLIERPAGNLYYDLNKITYNISPTTAPMPVIHPVELKPGEYLLECTKGSKVYRKKIWIPVVSSMDIFKLEDWFDNTYEVGYSIAQTGGTGTTKEILSKTYNMQLVGNPSYKEDIPVFIGERKHILRFEANRNKDNLYSEFTVDGKRNSVLTLTEISSTAIGGKKSSKAALDELYNKVKKQFNGKYTQGTEGLVMLEETFYIEPFKVDFRAEVKFNNEKGTWTGLAVEGNTITYKVSQVGAQKVKLTDFFN